MQSILTRRFLTSGLLLTVVLAAVLTPARSEVALPAAITLPTPHKDGATLKNVPLFKALNDRLSTRTYFDKAVSLQTLSDLLWAANGINRSNGKRTAPSPMNSQLVEIYVALPEGVFAWNGANTLKPVLGGDHRTDFGRPTEARAVRIIYVADYSKLKGLPSNSASDFANVTAGFIGQNVYLFTASEGLASLFQAVRDADGIAKRLSLKSDEHVLYTQTVGYGDLNAVEPTGPSGPPSGAGPNGAPPGASPATPPNK